MLIITKYLNGVVKNYELINNNFKRSKYYIQYPRVIESTSILEIRK